MTYAPMRSTALTVGEYAALPDEDGYRVELSRGMLVREPYPAALHGWIVARLTGALHEHARGAGGHVVAGAGFVLGDAPATVRSPDVAWISDGDASGGPPAEGFWLCPPTLAVEVNSPSNSASAVQEKVQQYLAAGSALVWVIDPPTRSALAYGADGAVRLADVDSELTGGDMLPALRLPLRDLFPER